MDIHKLPKLSLPSVSEVSGTYVEATGHCTILSMDIVIVSMMSAIGSVPLVLISSSG